MPPKPNKDELLEGILNSSQDLFILHALSMGVQGNAIRKQLKVDQWRITNISKLLKTRKEPSDEKR